MRRLAREDGVMLMETLLAIALLVVVLGATLGTMAQFNTTSRANQLSNDAQETARVALDQVSRELRNDGVGTPQAHQGVLQAGPFSVVFQAVNPTPQAGSLNTRNVEWVRYCLDTSDASNEKLYRQEFTWTTASPPATVPSTTSCPSSAWSNQAVLADNLFNNSSGQTRALFTPNSGDPASVSRIGLTAYVNANKGSASGSPLREARLDTAVVLRNQNTPPQPSFSVNVLGNGHIVLNASASTDPEGDPLTYQWSYDGTVIPNADDVTLEYSPSTSSGSHTIGLTVSDPGGETNTLTKTVNLG
jgi:type II secretory pathway component PulJ